MSSVSITFLKTNRVINIFYFYLIILVILLITIYYDVVILPGLTADQGKTTSLYVNPLRTLWLFSRVFVIPAEGAKVA